VLYESCSGLNKETRLSGATRGTLGPSLGAFIREHEYCGELASEVDDERVQMTCSCGARTIRRLERSCLDDRR
jgi:hypothetical protein